MRSAGSSPSGRKNCEEQALCRRCGLAYASQMHIDDLIEVEKKLGFRYELEGEAEHYQRICPRCRRAILALAQGRLWHQDISNLNSGL